MNSHFLQTPSISLLTPLTAAPVAGKGADAAKLSATAKKFESSFIAAMLQPMFDQLSTSAPFGGGAGESAFKSLLVDSMADKIAARGGIGLAPALQREMLRMQGAK